MADRVTKLAAQRAVVIFGASNCCMCHAVKTLFTELGVSWVVHELDKDPRGKDVERALAGMVGRSTPVPAVFIGGRLVGSTDKVMTLHLSGQLVPLLRQAGVAPFGSELESRTAVADACVQLCVIARDRAVQLHNFGKVINQTY